MKDKDVPVEAPEIDFDKYDEVVLVFPIWAARMAQYMKSYLNQAPFNGKNVTLIATSTSGRKGYMNGLRDSVDPSNDVSILACISGMFSPMGFSQLEEAKREAQTVEQDE